MSIVWCITTFFYLALHNLASATYVSAADQVPPQKYLDSCCYGMNWPSFGWIFPVMFFVMMIVIFVLMIGRRGMGCTWRDRMIYGPEFRDTMSQSLGEQPESAMEILNKRYAKGEIDKQEYEEKKAAIFTDS